MNGHDVMRRLGILAMAALLLVVAGCGRSSSPQASPTPASAAVDAALGQLTTDFVATLVAEDFETSTGYFDEAMLAALPVAKLATVWRQVTDQAGAYQSELGRRQESTGGYRAVIVTAQFEKAPLDIRVVFDSDQRIAGLFFQPASGASAAASPQAWQPPPYADPDQVTQTAVTVGSGQWRLPGTLTTPTGRGPWPAVVLVHGSGPNDRDETLGPNKPFRDLALGLAARGIAVLAYDKRTLAHRAAMAELTDLTVEQEVVADAALAVSQLRTTPGVDPERVFVLGHSLGGMLAPRIAQESDGVAGLILMAAAARPLEDLILEQHRYLAQRDGTVTGQEQQTLDEVAAAVARVKDPALDAATPASELLAVPAAYWLDLRGYHPADVAARLELPILLLQGRRDYQVTMADLAAWQSALADRSDVTVRVFPGLNHLMMTAPSTGSSSAAPGAAALGGPEDYEVAGHVAPEVVDAIASFINR